MKKIMFSFALFMVALMPFSSLYHASESSTDVPTAKTINYNGQLVSVPAFVTTADFVQSNSDTEPTFDITKPETQTSIIENPDGSLGSITVQPVTPDDNNSSRNSYYFGHGNSTWKIYYYSGVLNLQYYIDIYYDGLKSTIKRRYNESYTAYGYEVYSDVLSGSSTSAKYTVKMRQVVNGTVTSSQSHYLSSSVNMNKLTTSFH